MKSPRQNIVIIGGGIMGLMTAYWAASDTTRITVIDRYACAGPLSSSGGLTRSQRQDYLDSYYALLANDARKLWKRLENISGKTFLISKGCLNLVNTSLTRNTAGSYAKQSYRTMKKLKLNTKRLSQKALQEMYPQFTANTGSLDTNGGFFYLPTITKFLVYALKKKGVTLLTNTRISHILKSEKTFIIQTNRGDIAADKIVLTAGRWINTVLRYFRSDNIIPFRITRDRPKELKYIIPDKKTRSLFSNDVMPVFAYLDIGIYGHPWYRGKTRGIKIGYYDPPGLNAKNKKIKSIQDFLATCMPKLKDARMQNVTDVDQCSYDMTSDGDFIVGSLPGMHNVFVATGFCGTGYKFAPLIGKALADLATKGSTLYDIRRFSPDRFNRAEVS